MLPQTTLSFNKDGGANAKPLAKHFSLVPLHDKPKECNMELTWVEETVGQFAIRIPVLVNRHQVKVGEVLNRRHVEGDVVPPSAKMHRT